MEKKIRATVFIIKTTDKIAKWGGEFTMKTKFSCWCKQLLGCITHRKQEPIILTPVQKFIWLAMVCGQIRKGS